MKNANLAIYLALIVLLLGGLYFLGGKNLGNSPTTAAVFANTAASPKALSSPEPSFDFGTIPMAKGKVAHVFEFENAGPAAVTVKSVYTSCMCTSASLITDAGRLGPFGMQGHGFNPGISEAINPGKKAKVEVVFDPAAHGPAGVGPIQRFVRVETDSGYVDFEIKANVTP